MRQLRKSNVVTLEGIIRKGFRHMAATTKIKVAADGNVSGEVYFLKLDKKRRVLDMASLPFSGRCS